MFANIAKVEKMPLTRVAHEHLGEAPIHRQRCNTLPDMKPGDARAERFDDTGDLVTGHERNLRGEFALHATHSL